MKFGRTGWILIGLGMWTAPAMGQQQYNIPEFLDRYKPAMKGVVFDTPATPEAIAKCQVEVVYKTATVDGKPQKKAIGILIRDGDGRVLRRFLDTMEPRGTDQTSYYLDGFEVFRETDYNGDRKIDEVRWLNLGGTRIGTLKDGRIAGWRRISAEEASRVFVDGLVNGDLALINSIIATPEELQELGMPAGLVEASQKAQATRKADIEALTSKLAGWNAQSEWKGFDGIQPQLIPADASAGLKDDVEMFENTVIFAGPVDGKADLSQISYLQVPEMVKIGGAWKLVSLPRAVDPNKPDENLVAFDGIRSWVYRESGPLVADGANPELEKSLTALADLDQEWVDKLQSGDPKDLANYHFQRVQLLRKVIEHAGAGDRLAYEKEIVNSLSAAYQTGEYPAGLTALEKLIEGGGPLASYAAFRRIPAEYSLRSRDASKVGEAQTAWVADLKEFLEKFGKSDEVPEALFQLGNIEELNGDDNAAKASYERIVKEYPQSEPAPKATGALRRINLVGQTIALQATALDGQTIDLATDRGKFILLTFGSSEGEAFRREVADLVRLNDRFKTDGLKIVTVALDSQKETWQDFVQRSQIPWQTIFEPGGMDSRLANEFGVISYYYPTMFLIDKDGKVLDRNLRTALEVEKALEKPLAQKP
jgi:tetratricopeptide (TPR) repeat protein